MSGNSELAALEELLEYDEGQLSVDIVLDDIEAWDSLAVIGLIAVADERFGKTIAPSEIANAKTVGDIVTLLSS